MCGRFQREEEGRPRVEEVEEWVEGCGGKYGFEGSRDFSRSGSQEGVSSTGEGSSSCIFIGSSSAAMLVVGSRVGEGFDGRDELVMSVTDALLDLQRTSSLKEASWNGFW